jgi:ADP-L-glycero-D-manno-heptose 6-epimerase
MIVITGGAGFIGSNLVKLLEERVSVPLIVADVLDHHEKWQNLKNRKIHDLITPENLIPFLDENAGKITHIFHLGAISSTTETNADLIIETNFRLSKRLLSWCTEHNTPFIYASSAATYGDGAQGFVDFEDETQLKKFKPLNAYAWSKHLFDRYVIDLKEKGFKLPPQWVGLKFFNVFGPNEYHKGNQMSVVHHIHTSLKNGGAARLFKSYKQGYADGAQLRDFIWVDDCINVMFWFYENKNQCGIFNVGTGKARSFVDLAKSVFTALGKPENIEFIDMPETLREKYQYFTEAPMDKLRAAGYPHSFSSLEEGVKHYVQFLIQDDPYR